MPAGINLPMITFSFKPFKWSTFPRRAASVNTLDVSWNDADDKKLSVERAALVIPNKALFAVAGVPPSASTLSFSSS